MEILRECVLTDVMLSIRVRPASDDSAPSQHYLAWTGFQMIRSLVLHYCDRICQIDEYELLLGHILQLFLDYHRFLLYPSSIVASNRECSSTRLSGQASCSRITAGTRSSSPSQTNEKTFVLPLLCDILKAIRMLHGDELDFPAHVQQNLKENPSFSPSSSPSPLSPPHGTAFKPVSHEPQHGSNQDEEDTVSDLQRIWLALQKRLQDEAQTAYDDIFNPND